jgi:acetolactate synthase-1/2/3 large subunit
MGIGVPFAIGAKLARPDLPVIAFTGDFALGTQLAELETAARHRIGIIVVVANNAGAGGTTRQRSVLRTHPEAVLSFSTAVRYDRVADGLGCTGEHVASAGTLPGALLAALERAERDRTPTCIDVGTARDVPVVPSI